MDFIDSWKKLQNLGSFVKQFLYITMHYKGMSVKNDIVFRNVTHFMNICKLQSVDDLCHFVNLQCYGLHKIWIHTQTILLFCFNSMIDLYSQCFRNFIASMKNNNNKTYFDFCK